MIPVEFSKLAANLVLKEGAYLRKHSPIAARNFLLAIKKAKQILQDHPECGNRMHGLQVAGGRTLVMGDYLLDYFYDGVQIHVTNMRHGRTVNNLPAIDDDEAAD